MPESTAGWNAGGSLESRFFVDDGLWKDAPMLTGQGSFTPLPDVRNIMVTGGEGFIASWLVRHLVTKYPTAYNIVCFDKLDYCSSLNNSRMLEAWPNFKFFHGDITKPADVLSCLRKYNIDTIFHLAAQSHVDLSFGNSYSFTKNNVFGTHVLLESVVAVKTIKRFFHISTDEVYGEVKPGAPELDETTALAPTNPYSASKAAAEMYIEAYHRSFGLPAIIIRLNNVYGPHQFPEKIIPKFINLLQRKKPLWIHGTGNNTRRYLYGGDAADALDTILHKGKIGEKYNVDSKKEISNLELAKTLLETFGVKDVEGNIQHTRDRPFNDGRYAVCGEKLKGLDWEQKVSFEEGLRTTVEWYGRFSNWWGPIENILSPFPVVRDESGLDGFAKRIKVDTDSLVEGVAVGGAANGNGVGNAEGGVKVRNGVMKSMNGAGDHARKRKADLMEEV
ncbi:unnamed protein product [Zymoseptoria tritici ST99CH_1E4]|uniref:NAD(P)-binding domain-containing protein n=1 Tax=Zymoseptoria tritici ST99CH_1E4 TaxID=1276532 RepID=A0A2H1GI26_ZYMTR|nr:unnamed protein product [Zymoseptoria tritici ST99CH_1E4]